jgi:succinate dehydrogenase / fumarate reductase membrane anchor subunit
MATAQLPPPPIAAPGPALSRRSGRSNTEMYGWVFMRVSGVLLVVLVLGHLFTNLMVGDGITAIDFAFVAGKWANPFWQVYALVMLWLAMLHGTNGLRTIINDYAERDQTRFWLKAALYVSAAVIVTVGTLTVFTFDPCIDPESTLSVCVNR